MTTLTKEEQQIELPRKDGFYRTPFGFYVADHKSPNNLTWPKTYEWIKRDGSILIPNSYWSKVATLSKEELEKMEDTEVREETRKAQQFMLEYPSQFVNLIAIGNRILIEPYGFGVKVLDGKLKGGYIKVYDHDASRIIIGESQEKYNNAKLWVDNAAAEDAVRFAVRGGVRYGDWDADDRRFFVGLGYGPSGSPPGVAGLGFRPEGDQAYFDVNKMLEELSGAEERIRAARELLK